MSAGEPVDCDAGARPERTQQLAQLARPHTLVTRLSAASHATAFLLWEFPGFLSGADLPGIQISRPDAFTIARRRGVVGHRGQFFPDEIVELDGVFVTSRTRTWLDIAQVLRDISRDEDFAAADWILVRIGKTHMENDARAAVRKVRLALLARGWSPSE